MATGFIESLKRLGLVEYVAALIENGVIPQVGILQAQTLKHVARLAELSGDSQSFLTIKAATIQSEARTGLTEVARRAAQQATTVESNTEGPEQEYIWITEADSATCDPCMSNAALIKTLEEWQRDGMPGASTCEGGDRCRCDLFPAN